MKITRNLSISMLVILLTGLSGDAYAQRGDPASQQKELQEAMEMLKQQGMDPEQLKQLEHQLKSIQSMEQKRNENQEKAIQEKKQKEAIAKEKQRIQQIQSVRAEAGKMNIGIGDERVQLDVEFCSTSPNAPAIYSYLPRYSPQARFVDPLRSVSSAKVIRWVAPMLNFSRWNFGLLKELMMKKGWMLSKFWLKEIKNSTLGTTQNNSKLRKRFKLMMICRWIK